MNMSLWKKGDVLLAHNDKRQHVAIYLGDGMMVHASIGEKGTKGNKAGDQTGREICIAKVSGNWDFVLRYPDERIATAATLLAVDIANDDAHGYDQVNRNGNPDFDCSSLVIYCFNKFVPVVKCGATFTGDLRNAFLKCGFVEVSDMIKCNVQLVEVYPNDQGQHVKTMQTLLQMHGYDCGLCDGIYGNKTKNALDRYLRDHDLKPFDSVCGAKTWASLILN